MFRRPHDLSDEANTFGYPEFEPFNENEPTTVTSASARNNNARSVARSVAAASAVARPKQATRAGPPKRDLMAYKRVMDMTTTLQSDQNRKEAQAAAAAAAEEERLQQERNAKWEAVKASMSARPTPLHTVRAYDSDWSDSEEDEYKSRQANGTVKGSDAQSMRSVRSTVSAATASRRTALDALSPTLAEVRAARAGPLYAVESVPQRVCHFIYNWWMYFVYAISVALIPGVNPCKGADTNEYYNRRRYT